MTLLTPALSRHTYRFDNFGAQISLNPVNVTPGASNSEGSWTALLTSAVTEDVYGIYMQVINGVTAGASKPHLLDIGVDPAGGTSYTAIISNIVCGNSASQDRGSGFCFFFPIFIKSGSTIAVRVQGANATAGTVGVYGRAYGKRSRPDTMPVGTYSETIGTITNSNGVSFTPGNNADGTWVSLGTTVKPLWWWQVAYQIDNSTITAEGTYIEVAYGDGSNKHVIARAIHGGNTTESCSNYIPLHLTPYEAYCPVPAGSSMYIRGRCAGAPDSGYNGVAVGIGG